MSDTKKFPDYDFGITVVVNPLKDDGTYTVQIANNDPITINESKAPREKMIDGLESMK